MSKEELIQFLKENLYLRIDKDFYSSSVSVKIKLGEEIISEDWFDLGERD